MTAEKRNIVKLGEKLWGWKLCVHCRAGNECKDPGCPGQRHRSIQRYYQFCEAILRPNPLDEPFKTKFIDENDRHLQIILNVKSNPELSRQELRTIVWGTNSSVSLTTMSATIDRAVRTMLMVDCVPSYQPSGRLEEGQSRLPWGDGLPLSKFLEEAFPKHQHHVLSSINHPRRIKFKSELRADRLKKRLGITFRGTSDLRDHLRLSYTSSGIILNIYHHVGFLKEQLILTKAKSCGEGFSQSIKVCGALPRQLMLETIDSLQGILFPVASKKARKLLDRLVATEQWDPEIRIYEFGTIRNREEYNIPYYYLAEHLSELQNGLENPPPRGWLERQIERRTADRYMMMATLAGVAFAVLLGMLSLIVSCYQTWISYQAWQHPVSAGGP
ncbi:hypothetical protein BKA67DRAFT_663820 [Truncatella angustata]|uniref:Uncharacterized protein n=1 Tax=Truncatella angustata TaxID=152316 RepID=A0A9P8RKX1_9PEZI|nr:uncharacterized protein BKA67DRAFT_663820 [Truncatella angustata]KAH6645946.1 hypothetical protein BKA67DRAFT_663820 [Truncatella angustata]